DTNWSGTSITNSRLGTICTSVEPALLAKLASRPANGEELAAGAVPSATSRRMTAAAPIAHKMTMAVQSLRPSRVLCGSVLWTGSDFMGGIILRARRPVDQHGLPSVPAGNTPAAQLPIKPLPRQLH